MRINILYVIWSLGLGGAERALINLAKGLDKTRFNSIVCCLNDKGVFASELEAEGIQVIALNKRSGIDISIIFKISSLIKKHKIGIVHTHLWGANFWGRIAAKLCGVKVIIATEQNVDVWKNIFHLFADKMLSKFTNKIIAVSGGVKEFYAHNAHIDQDKITVIYNSVDLKKYYPYAAKGINKTAAMYIGLIGRLVPQKGHKYFLQALQRLVTRYNVHGVIVGDGPMLNDLKELSARLGLRGRVNFMGLQQNIPEIMRSLDILVLPSTREGLPLVLLEAMACGVPVVATDVIGTKELVQNEVSGILVPAEDEMALVHAITRLIEDFALATKLRENALTSVRAKFSSAKMVEETQVLYEQLLMSAGIK